MRPNTPGSAKQPTAENLPNCLFCPKPEKKTKWFHEDNICLIINKPNGEPMVVLKRHTTEPTDEEMHHIHMIVSAICNNYELEVILGHVPDHWHAHIRNYDYHPQEVLGHEML